jgi:hypothetical protein
VIDRYTDHVVVHQDKADFIELLIEAGVPSSEAENITDDEQEKLAKSLENLTNLEFNKAAAGGVRTVAGRFHFPLRKTVYTSVLVTASLTAAGIGFVAAPPIGAAGAVAAVLAAIQQLTDLVTKLSPVEFTICQALLEITKDRAAANKMPPGGTVSEVEAVFRGRKEVPPPTTAATLAELGNKNVLKIDVDGNETRYSIQR